MMAARAGRTTVPGPSATSTVWPGTRRRAGAPTRPAVTAPPGAATAAAPGSRSTTDAIATTRGHSGSIPTTRTPWFVSVSPGPFHAHSDGRDAEAYLYRWSGEGPWMAVAGPFFSMPYALRFADGALYAGFSDGGMLASDDGGERWSQVPLSGE